MHMNGRKIVLAIALVPLAAFFLLITYVSIHPYLFWEARESDAIHFSAIALKRNNPNICGKISSIVQWNSNQSLQHLCFTELALALQDETVCEKIKDRSSQGRCFHDLAQAIHDPSLCDKILDSFEKGECYGSLVYNTAEKELCLRLEEGEAKDRCFLGYVEKTGEMEICNSSMSINSLKDECFYTVMRITENPKVCDMILNDNGRENCKQEVTRRLSTP